MDNNQLLQRLKEKRAALCDALKTSPEALLLAAETYRMAAKQSFPQSCILFASEITHNEAMHRLCNDQAKALESHAGGNETIFHPKAKIKDEFLMAIAQQCAEQKTSPEALQIRLALRQFQQTRDALIENNQKLVSHFAVRYKDMLPYADLMQEGNHGFIAAIGQFDDAHKLELKALASRYIEGFMLRAIKKETKHFPLANAEGLTQEYQVLTPYYNRVREAMHAHDYISLCVADTRAEQEFSRATALSTSAIAESLTRAGLTGKQRDIVIRHHFENPDAHPVTKTAELQGTNDQVARDHLHAAYRKLQDNPGFWSEIVDNTASSLKRVR